MENQIILLDTSILIDHYRKKDKSKTDLYQISRRYTKFSISVITHYEIYIGAHTNQIAFWNNFFTDINILSVDIKVSEIAIKIYTDLKKNSKLLEINDLLIAATAIAHNIPCATLNKKHFDRIKDLQLAEY